MFATWASTALTHSGVSLTAESSVESDREEGLVREDDVDFGQREWSRLPTPLLLLPRKPM